MTILCLTGWQQPFDALAVIAPQTVHFDYSGYDDVKVMFAALPQAPQLAIGWSLGGQLLVRGVAEGYVKPKALLLLGAPFQWVEGKGIGQGVTRDIAAEVSTNYQRDPKPMLRNLNALVALGDRHEKTILRTLNSGLRVWEKGDYWLEELTRESCAGLDVSLFPPTTIIHGRKDKVIYPVNAEAFATALPRARVELWDECAHAPHLHDAPALRTIVSRYV